MLCHDFFTAYFTCPRKDRLTLLDLLCRGKLKFKLDQKALELMIEFGLATKWHDTLKAMLKTHTLLKDPLKLILKKPA